MDTELLQTIEQFWEKLPESNRAPLSFYFIQISQFKKKIKHTYMFLGTCCSHQQQSPCFCLPLGHIKRNKEPELPRFSLLCILQPMTTFIKAVSAFNVFTSEIASRLISALAVLLPPPASQRRITDDCQWTPTPATFSASCSHFTRTLHWVFFFFSHLSVAGE